MVNIGKLNKLLYGYNYVYWVAICYNTYLNSKHCKTHGKMYLQLKSLTESTGMFGSIVGI